jgi:hypothetical protein
MMMKKLETDPFVHEDRIASAAFGATAALWLLGAAAERGAANQISHK